MMQVLLSADAIRVLAYLGFAVVVIAVWFSLSSGHPPVDLTTAPLPGQDHVPTPALLLQ